MEDIRNGNGIGEKELLTASFGTSYSKNRRRTIGAIEDAFVQAFSDWSVRRGFTSRRVIDQIRKKEGLSIDSIDEAMERAKRNGVKRLVIQPTLVLGGREYERILEKAERMQDDFERLSVGKPLLHAEDDFKCLAQAITAETRQYDDGKTAVCFMGHGTESKANQGYERLQKRLKDDGYENYFIGTVEAKPDVVHLKKKISKKDYTRVVLQPLMTVAGDHANQDMAGDGKDSWKNIFETEGYEVICILQGLGELPRIRQLFVRHAKDAMGG